ncbi:MAG: hypothetical protein IKN49_05095 [Elusimicrobiaceae bacterium]|nr:hypothetical protein [Elusimicrobiaceae bacterium]
MKKDYTTNTVPNRQKFEVVELEEHRQTISGTLPEGDVIFSGYGKITRTESVIAAKKLMDGDKAIAEVKVSDGKKLGGRAKAEALIMYYDMALNQDGYAFDLSAARYQDLYGINENQYHIARDRLKAAGYLTPHPTRKGWFLFWRVPQIDGAKQFTGGISVADPEDVDGAPEDLPDEREVLQRYTHTPETAAAPAEDVDAFIARLRAEYADESEQLEGYIDSALKKVERYTNIESAERAVLEELHRIENAMQFGRQLRAEKRAAAPAAPAARQDDGYDDDGVLPF